MSTTTAKSKTTREIEKILAASGGAFIGGAAIKMMRKSDGKANPIASLLALGGGVYLVTQSKNATAKDVGLGLAAIGLVGTVANVAEKVPALQKFAPGINGMGDLYYDQDGNIIDLDGLNGEPQLVQDNNGQTYMIEGLNGDELENLVGANGQFDDYEYVDDNQELEGLAGNDLTDLV